MALSDLRLATMTFARRWDGSTLTATMLLLPSGDPFKPLLGSGTASFAGTQIALRAGIIGSLAALPSLADGTTVAMDLDPSTPDPPPNAAAVWTHLRDTYGPVDQLTQPINVGAVTSLRKALPDSYTALLPVGSSRVPGVASTDDFACTMRSQTLKPPAPAPPDTSWGQVISHALRNPLLADTLGLRYAFSVSAPDAATFADGGWLYVTLDAADGGTNYATAWAADPDLVKVYATRLPPLDPATPRPIFTPVLFPVANPRKVPAPTPDEGEIDLAIDEAERYSDGFARLVHARQPDSLDAHTGEGKVETNPSTDAGIQLAWDDEQVLVWHQRQLAIADAQKQPSGEATLEAPLGVLGYRVDVRVPVPGETPTAANAGWQSLMEATASVPPGLAGVVPGFTGELAVEPTPASPSGAGDFWLPLYFAQWRGQPLGTRDDVPHLLAGGTAAKAANASPKASGAITVAPSRFTGTVPIRLLYGQRYQFRVRLSDIAGDGPEPSDNPLAEVASQRTEVTFSRWVPPKGLRVTPIADPPHTLPYTDRIEVVRPVIGYPEAQFTTRYGANAATAQATTNALLGQLGIQPDGTLPSGAPPPNSVSSVGVPDPDVTAVEIAVEVRALAHDRVDENTPQGPYQFLYSTTRPVPPLAPLPPAPTPTDVATDVSIPPIELSYVDIDDVTKLATATAGPVPIPRSREVRVAVTPLASGPDGYFGTFPTGSTRVPITRGPTSYLSVRAPAANEGPLFTAPTEGRTPMQAHFFRSVDSGDPVATVMHDLANSLALDVDGMSLRGRTGERVLFGCSGFTQQIGPDGSTITFASSAELLRKWTVAVEWELERDWTWDGLSDRMIHVETTPTGSAPVEVGTIPVPRVASAQAVTGSPDRTRTRLVFLHGIDPAAADPRDGFTARDPYRFRAAVATEAAVVDVVSDAQALLLPVAVNPADVPQLASTGYALSEYLAAPDYSSTSPRHRQLWLQLDEAPADGDRLFTRLLAYAPDPLLYTDFTLEFQSPGDPPTLRLDPEQARTITPGQLPDDDGLEAMTELVAADGDPRSFLLPLPPGVDEEDPRLFGMWTYELRLGHKDPWSLANARYSRPLQVAGVQHPAPTLLCTASWRRGDSPDPAAPEWEVFALAPFATPVLADGRRVGSGVPYTTIGILLYAQAMQADGSGQRNILLAHQGVKPYGQAAGSFVTPYDYGYAVFSERTIQQLLATAGLPDDAPLSALAVEFYPPGGQVAGEHDSRREELPADSAGDAFDPFAPENFAQRRILRTSPLTKIDPYC